jgi:hypothetical protein
MTYKDVVDEQKAIIALKNVAESRVEHRPLFIKKTANDWQNRS